MRTDSLREGSTGNAREDGQGMAIVHHLVESPVARSDSAKEQRERYKMAFDRKIQDICKWSEELFEEIFITGVAAHIRLQVKISQYEAGKINASQGFIGPDAVTQEIANYAVHHRDLACYFKSPNNLRSYRTVLNDLRLSFSTTSRST